MLLVPFQIIGPERMTARQPRKVALLLIEKPGLVCRPKPHRFAGAYPRTWNHDFIQLPVVRKDRQHRPTVTEGELTQILAKMQKRKYSLLFALLAGTGLRIGEALGLRSSDFGPDCRVLHVRRSLWRGLEQEPKTSNALRVVDIPEVLARELRVYVSGISGYLFATAQGKTATTAIRSPSRTTPAVFC